MSTSEEDIAKQQTPSQMPTGLPRLSPKNKANRPTRLPRNASKNKQYMEEPGPSSPTRDRKGYVKNIKPSASGPSDDQVRAQTQCSEPPSIILPALPSPEVDTYDADTEVESDVTVETPPKSDSHPSTFTPKKGTIDQHHTTCPQKEIDSTEVQMQRMQYCLG